MFRLRYVSGVLVCVALLAMAGQAQAQPPVAKPQPPPAGATPAPAKPVAPATGAQAQQPGPAKPAAAATTAPAQTSAPAVPKIQPATDAATEAQPTETQLGVRLYPGATFLGSYDAGRGQRFYLFGVQQTFSNTVTFYKTDLGKGELVFEAPPIHMFDVGKFREETMAFPPSVTIKDYTWGEAPGYPNPKPGATPATFPTVIQIVPQPATAAGPIR
ncbi:MAG: hypothetical protein NTV05_13880 [Acidobacteria bacterium]|nr:hypothetical protein [Acidobacteriota bacterium]